MPGLSRDPDTVRAVSTSSESLEESRVVRQITVMFGAFTLAFSVLWLILS
jgi:hypothetical protein